ncbi:D-glycero-beta-D-manno-heptose 1,7-bisphosphate 7-phosphatase [Bacteroides ovatus]|uniref:D-glycero-beta-D-manno-heptose 1,7-bisphosphate 7-phosphatase n=1 Tax=Bacteroides ovatus TaxID=28116 RepID=UPI00202FFF72|nr:D-glycero-beta-D-manno-heptose 1,7-bisphosphate 7-phosphatase [Bacteroides ovatus]MCM1719250.1 D-glycero-beta-D-manno-heptose 1,7-bisphosphate 7-phosphatase [Bacteroides ovatus]MCM1758832.1 D-glycero-beta-D-manno-heptose 1,7-bisphosphate 7-phosphatase [Bacteroides ovatus]MCM1864517.1 D-glycero-beta-D-manno-heptose 1,7-bisphosphate 7-phosphatase [Bacteroides ovatus]MCM1912651.1 D-glycero-beta-D-manno-heptose 1,7-bisphosphate 7-phosphatase [Bacteroides ovatus]
MKTVIMAGGRGTRIVSVANDVPKPMINICGKPILEYQIDNLKACGLTDIILVIGYLGEKIKDYFGDGSRFGVCIEYFIEDHPLGTAGALFKMPQLTEDFLLLCGDVIIDVDFNRFIAFHKEKKAWASLVAHPNGHPYDSSLLVTEIEAPQVAGGMPLDTNRVICWIAKEDERLYYKNRVNAGIELISPELLKETMKNFVPCHPEAPDKIDLDRDVLKTNIGSGRIYAYDTPEYVKDMGTPDRFFEAENDIKTGKVHARNLKNRQKAIFLDRDGTINKMVGFVTKPEQFEFLPGVAKAIKAINKSGYLAIVITNQPVIARGDCTFEQLQTVHNKMETELGKEGAFVDGIYVCPHHTDKGFAGERPEYKCDCDCRKPKPGLLLQAAKDFNIDLSQSYMIGDSDRDVKAGENAGVKKAIKVGENMPSELLNVIKEIIRK